jgi:hypothetical protein
MSPEERQAFAVAVAGLIEAKLAEAVKEMKTYAAQAGDAGHAAITRAEQLETIVDDHERRLAALERKSA